MASSLLDIVVFVYVLTDLVLMQSVGISREYCLETFSPKCPDKQVVVIETAIYGRIRTGRCMKKDFGLPPCYADELQYLDSICSGRLSCDLFVPSPELATKQSCLEGLTSYLEASYDCQSVYFPIRERCISPEKLEAHKKPGYLASLVSSQTTCGLHESPWIIAAEPGQKIQIHLDDYSWQNSSDCQFRYGYILDMKSDDVISICGGGKRSGHLYTSSGDSVQIVLEPAMLQKHYFIIQYKAIGCPQFDPPSHSNSHIENGSLVVTCLHENKTWRVTCVGDIWLGIVGNCSLPPKVEHRPEIVVEAVQKQPANQPTSGGLPTVSNNHVIAFGLGCLTLIICCTVVFFGLFCSKRYEARILEKIKGHINGTYADHNSIFKPVRSSMIYRPASTLPPYTSPEPKSERLPPRVPDPMTTSDYLAPQPEQKEDDSVVYYVLENPAENMSEEMYQSIKLHHSLQSN